MVDAHIIAFLVLYHLPIWTFQAGLRLVRKVL